MVARRGCGALVGLALISVLAFLSPTSVGAADTSGASLVLGAADTSDVFLVVGVPGARVDVLVDEKSIEKEVEAKSVVGPLELTSGQHTVTFRSDAWSATADVEVDRPSLDVVVHRPADPAADPTVTVFGNEVQPISANKARVTIAHTAVVPPADVRVSGKVLFSNIANGEFVTAEVPAATYSVDIVATGGSDPVFGPVEVTLQAGALNRVFAIGDPEEGTMDAIVQVLPLSQTSSTTPDSVPTGSAGLVATNGPTVSPWTRRLPAR